MDQSPRYIWANFGSDIIQIRYTSMAALAEGNGLEKEAIRHLKIECLENKFELDDSEFFHYKYSRRICCFPGLENCDVLVDDGLAHNWTTFAETHWGTRPTSNVRVVDAETEEFIDAETNIVYQDYVDTNGGEHRGYVRDLSGYHDEDWGPEDDDKRYEAMMKIKVPLSRIDINC